MFENYAIAVNNGTIVDLLPADIALAKYDAIETYRLDKHTLIPGLINTHTHTAMSLFRGIADDLPLMDWLNNHIWPAEQLWVSLEFVEDGAHLTIAEMIRSGTTCFNDMYFYPDHTAEVASEIGIRAMVGLFVLDFPTSWAQEPQEYFEKGEHVHDRFKHSPLIQTAFAPHAPYTVSNGPLEKIVTLSEELDLQIHMHVHETEDEINQSNEQHGKRPFERLNEIGVLSNRLMAVHMTQIDQEDIELITKYKLNVIHCPESNLKLASGFCPSNELLNSDVNVALGTDGSASNNDLDMIGEMRTATLLGKGIARDSSALAARTALRMATLNGARALNIDLMTGSLVKGKEADIVAINLSELETQPLYDPVSQIVYATTRNQVTDVWVAGKQLLKNRELTTINEERTKQKAKYWQEKIMKV